MPVESRLSGRDDRAALLGSALAPLFDDQFVHSCDLYEAYVEALAGEVFVRTGLAGACAVPRTVDEAVAVAGLEPGAARVPVAWLCALLTARGWLVREGMRYRAAGLPDAGDAAGLRAAQARHDPACLPSYDLAALAARHYPAVLAGAVPGEQVLADPEALDLWGAYFSNDNPLYAISNILGAMAAAEVLQTAGGAVLELGAGLGSAAAALLSRVPCERVHAYRVTDVSPLFLRRARRALTQRFPDHALEFAALDLDGPFAAVGAGHALVYGVNVLHVARDLAATLAAIRASLAPGGSLVFAECVRPAAGAPVHAEFVFNLLQTFRAPLLHADWRPHGGFLSPEDWTRALVANGYTDVSVLPDVARIREAYPSFVVAAFTARRA